MFKVIGINIDYVRTVTTRPDISRKMSRREISEVESIRLRQCRMAAVSLDLERKHARKVLLNDPFTRFF
ncbi:hypothetical protein ACFIOY_29875 [Bradyrhizobium sp. TZ2]